MALTLLNLTESWDLLKHNVKREAAFIGGAWPAALGPLVTQHVYACKDGVVLGHIQGGAQAGRVLSSSALTEWANGFGYALELKDLDWAKLDPGTAPQAATSPSGCGGR